MRAADSFRNQGHTCYTIGAMKHDSTPRAASRAAPQVAPRTFLDEGRSTQKAGDPEEPAGESSTGTHPGAILLEVHDLTVEFPTSKGPARAVDGVGFSLWEGEVVGLVGESGCGKSATALALLGLLPPGRGRAAAGRILFQGEELRTAPERRLRDLRGNRIAMIFQEPMTALNPVLTVGEQVAEVLRRHRALGRRAAWARAEELLGEVGIPAPGERARDYPHQLSGGMRQRVMIAMAIACEPRLLVADEPTTALDVTVQAQMLALLSALQKRTGLSILLITHDLGVVAQTCHRVLVMYAGRIVEEAPVAELFRGPRHPYTVGLLASMPAPPEAPCAGSAGDQSEQAVSGEGPAGGDVIEVGRGRARLTEIPGTVPSLTARPQGCTFSDRCPRARERCGQDEPGLAERAPGHRVRCFFPHEPPEVP